MTTPGHHDIQVLRADIQSETCKAFILALNEELTIRYPEEGANHFRLDPDEVAEGRGAFLVAYTAGQPVGCGAVRRNDQHTAEIKRMYVTPQARGKGIGRVLLTALEAEARRLGVSRIVLETGDRQPEAIALYERAGFVRIPLFGEYLDSPLSVCMAKNVG